jgi:hypothetical protein
MDVQSAEQSERRNRARKAGFLVACVSFLASVAVAYIQRGSFYSSGDTSYLGYAQSLIHHHVYIWRSGANPRGRPPILLKAYRPPGYVWLLAAVGEVGPITALRVGVVQSALVAVSSFSSFAIGNRIFSLRVGVVAGLVTGLFPYTLFHDVTDIDTALATACIAVTIALVLKPSVPRLLGASAVISLGVLTRPTELFIVILLVAVGVTLRDTRRIAVICACVVAVALGGWCGRDLAVTGQPVFISDNAGWNLWLGNNQSTAKYVVRGRSLDNLEYESGVNWVGVLGQRSEVARDNRMENLALAWIKEHPAAAAENVAVKSVFAVLPVLRPGAGVAKEAGFSLPGVILYGLSLIGFWVFRRKRESALLGGTIIAVVLPEIIVFPYTRLIAPSFPLMGVFAGAAVTSGLEWFRRSGQIRRVRGSN